MKRAVLCLALLGCAPSFEDEPTRVQSTRLVAVLFEPPELRPGEPVHASTIFAGSSREAQLGFCTVPRPLGDPRALSEACFASDNLVAFEADQAGAHGTVPSDACALFGPAPSQARLRPADPDASGGFYQPVVIDVKGERFSAALRIHCPLPNAPTALASELAERYEFNQNPELLPELNAEPGVEPRLRSGASQQLRLAWPSASREAYVWLPPGATKLASRHESLRVTWFARGGSFRDSSSGETEDSALTFATNTLHVDSDATAVDIWAVLQDSRGGSAVRHWQLAVTN